jgi:hypothetical protein
MFLSFG